MRIPHVMALVFATSNQWSSIQCHDELKRADAPLLQRNDSSSNRGCRDFTLIDGNNRTRQTNSNTGDDATNNEHGTILDAIDLVSISSP